jgi:GNAT superfamily N-acetyltransferase
MAITSATLRAAKALRVAVDAHVDDATRKLVAAWVHSWDSLKAEWEAAAKEITDYHAATGAWPPSWKIQRLERVQRALQVTETEILKLARTTGATVSGGISEIVPLTTEAEAEIIATQMPRQAGTRAELTSQFNRVDPDQVRAITQRSIEQMTALSWPLAEHPTQIMAAQLRRGISLGLHPDQVAWTIVSDAEGAFNGGLSRAMTIARTEMLDAHRAASKAQHLANADLLIGWQWQAQLDRRTCPSCWGQHGSVHDLDEDGPLDHQNGRCARLPLTKSWRELGFNIDEPPSLLPNAQAEFDALSPAEQLHIMGPARMKALSNGASLQDMSTRRTTAGWRDSFGPTPVSQLGSKFRTDAPTVKGFDLSGEWTKETAQQMADAMQPLIDDALAGTGLVAKQDWVTRNFNGTIALEWQLKDPDRAWISGHLQRELRHTPDGKLEIHNDLFTLPKEFQGMGIATRAAANLEPWYAASGVEQISVQANIDVGGYTWAKQGFGWDSSEAHLSHNRNTADSILDRVDFRTDDAAVKAQIGTWRKIIADDPPSEWPTPYEMAMMGWKPGAETWPGKEAMLGTNWYGVKPL